MKKLICLCLIAAFLLALPACSQKQQEKDLSKKFMKIADNYVSIVFGGNISLVEKMAPDEFWDLNSMVARPDGYSTIMQGYSTLAFYEWYAEQVTKAMGKYYGEMEVSYEIAKYDPLSESRLDAIKDALDDDYDIEREDVEGGWSVTIKYEVKGSLTSQSGKHKVSVICIDGDYYWVEYDSSSKLPVRFPICSNLAD